MKGKKILALVLACMCVLGSLCVPVAAAQPQGKSDVIIMATNHFDTSIPANKTAYIGSSLSLVTGEVVAIKATYTPFSAGVDFGVVAPDGRFYGLSGSNGVFDEAIEVTQTGLYRLAICNRSSVTVSVSGYVNY